MRKGFLMHVYEEMRKFFPTYEEAVSHMLWLCTRSIWISLHMRKILFYFFISVRNVRIQLKMASFRSECTMKMSVFLVFSHWFHSEVFIWKEQKLKFKILAQKKHVSFRMEQFLLEGVVTRTNLLEQVPKVIIS